MTLTDKIPFVYKRRGIKAQKQCLIEIGSVFLDDMKRNSKLYRHVKKNSPRINFVLDKYGFTIHPTPVKNLYKQKQEKRK